MWNAGLDEAQAGIKIARRNINNLRYADDTTLMAESQEELKSLLTKVKEESEKAGLKLNSGHRTGRDVFIPIPKRGIAKECSNYCIIALISHASKVMLKILQARFQQYVNWKLPDVQTGFRKGRGTRDQIANIHWIIKKVREFQKKNIYFCFIDYAKAFKCESQQMVENS